MWFAIVWWFLGTHQSCYVRTKYSERGALQASEAGGKKRQTQVFNTVPNLDSNISMLLRAKWYTNTCVLERARLCSHSVLVDCFTLSFTKLPQSQWSLLRMKITKSHGFWWKLNKCFTWSQIIQLNAKKKNPYISSPYMQPHGLYPSRLLCPWGFSRQEYGSGLPCPPPGDLPNPGLSHCRQILYHLSHQQSPRHRLNRSKDTLGSMMFPYSFLPNQWQIARQNTALSFSSARITWGKVVYFIKIYHLLFSVLKRKAKTTIHIQYSVCRCMLYIKIS